VPINNDTQILFSNKGLNIGSISSQDGFNANDDYLGLGSHSSYEPILNSLETFVDKRLVNSSNLVIESNTSAAVDSTYNPTSGYGLINAAAAVAQAANRNTFADVPNLGGNNWGADLVKAPEAWAQGYTGEDVVVAVLDTGVDYNHNDLNDNIWKNTKEIAGNGKDDDGNGYVDDYYGWNFSNNSNDILDRNGHGTHVAGTIAGEKNNFGVTGIAYDAKIMPVKVLNDSGSGSSSSIADGIYYAVDNGADVINLSLGSDFPNWNLRRAIEYASNQGVVVVMAAGNDGDPAPDYPARFAENWGIAVGAVDRNNNMADFSNRAGTNQLSYVTAPGVQVYSTVPDNKYASYSGTSMAAPHVAGVAALMLSANRTLTDAEVREIIAQTSGNRANS
jgi:subtilisin